MSSILSSDIRKFHLSKAHLDHRVEFRQSYSVAWDNCGGNNNSLIFLSDERWWAVNWIILCRHSHERTLQPAFFFTTRDSQAMCQLLRPPDDISNGAARFVEIIYTNYIAASLFSWCASARRHCRTAALFWLIFYRSGLVGGEFFFVIPLWV